MTANLEPAPVSETSFTWNTESEALAAIEDLRRRREKAQAEAQHAHDNLLAAVAEAGSMVIASTPINRRRIIAASGLSSTTAYHVFPERPA